VVNILGREVSVALVRAEGIHVRHAVGRALATHNRSLADATWRLLSTELAFDARGRVASAAVTVRLEPVGTLVPGVVNPDGAHPLMVLVPGLDGVLLDVFPVTWERWERVHPGGVRPDLDPWCPRLGIAWSEADRYARSVGKRLPSGAELGAAWGPAAYPWGEQADPRQGRDAAPRFAEVPEVGMYPSHGGIFDLGAWMGHWTAEGTLVGEATAARPAPPGEIGPGFRCAAEL
jgi:hypothetical protein